MTIAYIPPTEVTLLTELRLARDLPALRARVAALRAAGYTLAGIGEPFGAPLSTIRAWETAHRASESSPVSLDGPSVPTPNRPPRRAGGAVRIRTMRTDVPVHDRDRLRRLAGAARVVRRRTAADHPGRTAQRELEVALRVYLDRHVPCASLARYCGVTNRAVRARLERAAARPPVTPEVLTVHGGYAVPGVPVVPVAPLGAAISVTPSTPYVTVWADRQSLRGALFTHWDGDLVATRPYDEVSRSRGGDGSAPIVLRPDVSGAAFLDGWLRAPADGSVVAVPLVLVEHLLGWGSDRLAPRASAPSAA